MEVPRLALAGSPPLGPTDQPVRVGAARCMRARLRQCVPNRATRNISEVIRTHARIKGRTDLDIEFEQSPVFGGDGVRLVWHAYG